MADVQFTWQNAVWACSTRARQLSLNHKWLLTSTQKFSPTLWRGNLQSYAMSSCFTVQTGGLFYRFVEDENAGALCSLEAFAQMYRMLVHFVAEYPELVAAAEDQVAQFVKDPKARDKDVSETILNAGSSLLSTWIVNGHRQADWLSYFTTWLLVTSTFVRQQGGQTVRQDYFNAHSNSKTSYHRH